MTAWDLRRQHNTLVAILTVETVTTAWALGLRNLHIPGPDPIFPTGMPFDHARNHAVEILLGTDLEWLFFLDSDVIPPRDAIARLQGRRKPLISGVYHRRSPPHGLPVMIKDGRWVTDYPANAVIEVDLVGAGCFLVHRSVFEQCPHQSPDKKWFSWDVDKKGTGIKSDGRCLSEDFSFNVWVKEKLGIPTLVDTSVQCRHAGYSQAVRGGMYPLEIRSDWAA